MTKPHKRKSRDERFMDLCRTTQDDWSTCDRARVGAVLALGGEQLGPVGYNGSPSGQPHCDDVGHLLDAGHCIRTLHAESNALWYAGRDKCAGATLYTTHMPCYDCAKEIARAGVARVVYESDYGMNELALRLLFSVCRVDVFRNGAATPAKFLDVVDYSDDEKDAILARAKPETINPHSYGGG